MDKRKEANLRVKKGITMALFSLMHQKSFSDITISEITIPMKTYAEALLTLKDMETLF